MGVQKSKKSIKFTKYSLIRNKKTPLNNIMTKKNKTNSLLKDNYKQTRIFYLINREAEYPIFFDI